LNAFPLNRSGWTILNSVLLRFDESVISSVLGDLGDSFCRTLFHIEILSELQQTEEALRILAQLEMPRTPSLIALEATVYYHHRNFERSAQLFEELRAKDPFRIESLEQYSNLLFVEGNTATLASLSQQLSSIDKFRPECLAVMGNLFALSGRHEDAIRYFTLALRFDPSFSFAWTLIGHEYVELENIPSAITAYRKAYDANPRDIRAHYGSAAPTNSRGCPTTRSCSTAAPSQ
jgi:anaphase-promoting complex subunit 8